MFKIGDKVRFIDQSRHFEEPDNFPPAGTIGTVTGGDCQRYALVQWPKGTTSEEDEWYTSTERLELVKD